jgi:hypothetical protein
MLKKTKVHEVKMVNILFQTRKEKLLIEMMKLISTMRAFENHKQKGKSPIPKATKVSLKNLMLIQIRRVSQKKHQLRIES